MGNGSVSSKRWHDKSYPALGPEETARLFKQLDTKNEKIAKLSSECDRLTKANHEQEQRIHELEHHIAHMNNLQKSYEELIVAKVGYRTPHLPENYANAFQPNNGI